MAKKSRTRRTPSSHTRENSGDGALNNIPGENRLLRALPRAARDRLLDSGRRVAFAAKNTLIAPNAPIKMVFFPLSGVFSLLTNAPDGGRVETVTIGNEGMVGVPLLLGAERIPSTILCQVPGEALRLDAGDFLEAASRDPHTRRLLLRYSQYLFNFAAQCAACNRTHDIDERCARWLLMTHDRVASDEFPLTHEFLAQMLGVRRAGVTVAAGMLQRAGFIRYSRGIIRVVDREGLRGASCDCYDIIQRDFRSLLG